MNYDRLRQLRTERNITLQEMAVSLGLRTAGGYSRIESGENKLNAEHLPALANKFGMELDELTTILFFKHKLDVCSNSDNQAANV